MPTDTLVSTTTAARFQIGEVRRRLRIELQTIADDAAIIRPEWEPLLDSKRVVGAVLVIEDLFPSFKIAPDKLVRKGGYNSVNEAIDDMVIRIERLVEAHHPRGTNE